VSPFTGVFVRENASGSVRPAYMSAEEGLHAKRRKARILMPQQRNSLAINTDNRVVSVANRGRNAARIPDTPERQRLEDKRSIREVVFGAQDGILTTLGIVTGFSSASPDRAAILLTGFLSLLVGAISMGVGEYLGGKSEREVVQNAIDFERQEMLDAPAEEFAEQVAYYRLKGFTDDEAVMIVRRLEKNPDIWLHEMVRDEFGIDVREAESGGLRASFAMAGSFAIGAAPCGRVCCWRFSRSSASAISRGRSAHAIRISKDARSSRSEWPSLRSHGPPDTTYLHCSATARLAWAADRRDTRKKKRRSLLRLRPYLIF
jgi:VIT1/CCC1 family predicted Fe2+/Mn2+ transporter